MDITPSATSQKFRGRKLLVASMHGKERAIAPMLEAQLGIICITEPDLDTDRYGTFTGEVERKGSPLQTVRIKCLEAMNHTGFDLGIATEATFGPHPQLGLIPSHHEIMLLMDTRLGLEIRVSMLTTETNFASRIISSEEELMAFARSVGFPAHGLILRTIYGSGKKIKKGITNAAELSAAYRLLSLTGGTLQAETDMRAHMNPTRMSMIRSLTGKLLYKMISECLSCATPGFGEEELIPGLPCRACGQPTRSPLSRKTSCSRCGNSVTESFPDGRTHEEPGACQYCNP
ncbi:MAG: DUF6671 family protein [Bacteroidota bacterium]